jgi:hypothetical protein
MRFQSVVLLVAIVCLLPLTAAADISRISPQSVPYGSVEDFITLFGSGFAGTESVFVVYDGPGGQFSVIPQNFLPGTEENPQYPDDVLQAFVPVEVAIAAGPYVITVVSKNVGEDARTIGSAIFTVQGQPLDGPPLIAYPETVYQEAENSEGAAVTYDVSAQNPDGEPVPVSCFPQSGSRFSMGTSRVECTASNSFGTSSASITVVVADSTPPVVTVPEFIDSTSSVVTYEASAVDNIDGTLPVTCSPASGSTFGPGLTLVICEATDAGQNTGFGTFFVRLAGGLPVLTVPNDITATSPDGATIEVPYTVSATNNGEVLCYPSGFTFSVGTTTVTCTATNFTGSDTKSFNVRVVSGAAPEITVPANITAEATSPAGTTVTFTVTATNDATVACTPASGSTFALGTTTVNCTATNAGGSDSGSFTVTVVDTTDPVLSLPADITAEATSASGAAVNYVASASDLVDTDVAVQCTPASGATFALGTTTVSCSATDDSGNSSTGTFTVTVVDSTPPQILSVAASPSVLWPPNHKMVDISVVVVAIDAVDPTPVSRIISVSSSQPINGTGDGDTGPDWQITGPLTLKLRSERSHGIDRTYTITIETVDDAGNAATATETVVVSQTKRRAVH